MRVYYVASDMQGCYLVRCLLPLAENGWDGDKTSLFSESVSPEQKSLAAQMSDIVVFHRPDSPKKLELARALKAQGKKIVFDNDDTYKDDGGLMLNEFMDKERFDRGMDNLNAMLDVFIKEADLITCSTDFLKEEYLKLNPNVITLPNCVDPFYFDEPIKNDTGVYRIGIVGSLGISGDIFKIEPIVKHFHNDKRIKLVLFSLPKEKDVEQFHKLYKGEYEFWEKINVEWQPFVNMDKYYETLNELKLDLMIIPRADNYFNRCKSNLKFLEASMLEIPVIAQAFPDGNSPYQTNPDDQKHLILATDTEDWIEKINYAIDHKDEMQTMAKGAKEYVIENYSIEKKAHLWEEAYETLKDNK